MALSLQEQLLKSGLADKKSAKKIQNEKRKKDKIRRKSKIVETDEVKASVKAQQEAKKQKDMALNAEAKKEAEKKQIAAQIIQMIDMNQQPINNGDIKFQFTHDNVIKQLLVNEKTRSHLQGNKLAIVTHKEGYAIIPIQVADKIAERDASCILYRADQQGEVELSEEEQDWYADYEIPDDLVW